MMQFFIPQSCDFQKIWDEPCVESFTSIIIQYFIILKHLQKSLDFWNLLFQNNAWKRRHKQEYFLDLKTTRAVS